jgi:hypothetical protein
LIALRTTKLDGHPDISAKVVTGLWSFDFRQTVKRLASGWSKHHSS